MMGRRVDSGLQVRSGAGADANTWEATESKMTAGSDTETVGVMGKSEETASLEVEMVVGMESGVDTEVGMDLELTADWSGVVAGAEASARCAIATARGDAGADLRLMVACTATGDEAVVVAKVRGGTIAEMILSACMGASKFAAPTNARLRIAGMEMEWVG